jgi:hypothetical protein
MRTVFLVIGILSFLFGLACFNYTKASAWDHHQAFARQHQLPEPSNGILLCGIVAVSFGAGVIGFSFGRRAWSRDGTGASATTTANSN